MHARIQALMLKLKACWLDVVVWVLRRLARTPQSALPDAPRNQTG